MAECAPVDLGNGVTVAAPCTSLFGYVCSYWDYYRWRRELQLRRNTLVVRLNALNKLVEAGKIAWSARAEAAEQLCDFDSYAALTDGTYPDDWTVAVASADWLSSATYGLAKLTERIQGALCDVDGDLELAGAIIPQAPPPPPPQAGIADGITNLGASIAKGAGYLFIAAALAAAGYLGFKYLESRSS